MATSNPKQSRLFSSATQAQTENKDSFLPSSTPKDKGRISNKNAFWSFAGAIELAMNWDKSFPFQLLLLRKRDLAVDVGGTLDWAIEDTFTLPIPPQALSISTPFAIDVAITQGGVIEEHNAAPMRLISLQGTTGVFPLRGTAERPGISTSSPEVNRIFAGTLRGAQQVADVFSSVQGNVNSYGEMIPKVTGTGFHQFLLLKRFLESYVNRKKNGDAKLRLAFANWKEKEIYLVTPATFDVQRQAGSIEYPFNFSMRAWKRISLQDRTEASIPYDGRIGIKSTDVLVSAIRQIENARKILEGAKNTISGFRQDFQGAFLTPLRQVNLFLKDAAGVAIMAADLPSDIIKDLKAPIVEFMAIPANFVAFKNAGSDFDKKWASAIADLSVSENKTDTGSGDKGSEGNQAAPANKFFGDLGDSFDPLSKIDLSALRFPRATANKIQTEIDNTKKKNRKDFQDLRDQALRLLADYSDEVGVGDDLYSTIYGRPVSSSTRTPSDTEWENIYAFSTIAQQYDVLAASSSVNQNQTKAIDYVAGLANRSGIAFNVPVSKYAVPFPYGATLEQLSSQYLGTPDRWHEIATLNGLVQPYVDETGFRTSLVANGNANRLIVNDGSNLFVGQKVWISSTNVSREVRRVQKVTQMSPTNWVVDVDGAQDLVKYTTAAGAFLEAFLPGTVNSQQQIFIPSDSEPTEEDYGTKDIPGVDYFDPLVKSGGIDLLLTPDGDLAITPDGDSRLAVGLANLIQKVKLAIGTPKGSLLHHPGYGIGLIPGVSTADLSIDDVKQSLKNLFKEDSDYLGVQNVSVWKSGGTLRVNLSVGLSATGQYIPIQVDLES